MKRAAAFVTILLASLIGDAQTKYGSPSDLKGSKAFYVDAGGYVKTRNDLVKRIEEKTTLKVVAAAADADVLIAWTWTSDRCAKAVVARLRDDAAYVVWNWEDCGSGWTSPQFLFVRKFANLLEENR